MACPNCGAPGGGPSGCGSCGLGKDPNVGGAFNAGQDQLRHNSQNKTGGCFTGDSLVLTPNGKKRLENIRKGEHVLCLNEENVLTSEIVKRVSSHARRQVFEVESDNAELSFRATALHPILTSKGWVAVKDICIGDTLITLNESGEKREHVVRRIAPASKSYTVHNLSLIHISEPTRPY
mgnify:FL=1